MRAIEVKRPGDPSRWIWGAIKAPGRVFHELHRLWLARERRDEYFGTLVNAYLARAARRSAYSSGEAYVDVGTLNGYRAALQMLEARARAATTARCNWRSRSRTAAPSPPTL